MERTVTAIIKELEGRVSKLQELNKPAVLPPPKKEKTEAQLLHESLLVSCREDTAQVVKAIKGLSDDVTSAIESTNSLTKELISIAKEPEERDEIVIPAPQVTVQPTEVVVDLKPIMLVLGSLKDKLETISLQSPVSPEKVLLDSTVTDRTKSGSALEVTDMYSDGTTVVTKIEYGK